jgi:hypothetical protein
LQSLFAVFDAAGNLVGVSAGDFSLDTVLLRSFSTEEVDRELNGRIDLETCSNITVTECKLEVRMSLLGHK